MIRILFLILALVAPFFFPWPVAALLAFIATFLFPFAGIVLGMLFDLLYFLPGAAFIPYGTLFGAAATAFVLVVQRFVKTRSIGA